MTQHTACLDRNGGTTHGIPSVLLSRKDRGHERRGAVVLLCFFFFSAGAPVFIALAAGEDLRPLSMVAFFPWAFNFWLFGWARMVAATAQLHVLPTGKPVVDAATAERLGQGLLWSHGCVDGTAQLKVSLATHRPTATASILPKTGGWRPVDEQTAYAWAHALSGGNLFSLSGFFIPATVSADTPPTAHHSITCQQALHAAERAALLDLVPPDAWHTTLSRWLPGRMPA